MFENFKIPEGFKKVDDLSVLTKSGDRTSLYLFKDDKIQISDEVVSKERKGSDGQMHTIFYIVCSINNKEPKPIPFGSFRRFPKDIESFLPKSTLMRDLYHGSDFERKKLLAGKTLKVVELVEGEAIDWDKSPVGGPYVYRAAKFPVFTIA